MGTLAEQLIEQGRVEGEARGEARGRVEGEARGRSEILVRLLELKFGVLDERARDQVANASLESINTFAQRVLSATTLDDVLRDD